MIKQNNWQYRIKYIVIIFILPMVCGSVISLYLRLINQGEVWRSHIPWLILGLPIIGALCTYLYEHFSLMRPVGNQWLMVEAKGYHQPMPLKTLPVAMTGTVLSHWFGASIGREDMASHITGTISLSIASHFNLKEKERHIIVLSALASAFSAVFGTPIAATVFAFEIVKDKHINASSVVMVLMTSVLTLQVTKGWGISYTDYHLAMPQSFNLFFFICLLCACLLFTLCGKGYMAIIHWMTIRIQRLIPSRVALSFIGGTLVIVIALIGQKTEYLGLSSQMQKEALTTQLPLDAFLWKGILTVLSVSSGFRGGTITPMFDIGSSIGYTLGHIFGQSTHFMSSMGFIGVFVAAMNAPLTSVLLGVELFGIQGTLMYVLVVIVIHLVLKGYRVLKK